MFNGVTFSGIVHQSGGCGPELLGALDLLQLKKVPVRCVVPINDKVAHGDRAKYLTNRGVEVLEYYPGVYSESQLVVSFCEKWTFDYIEKYSDRPAWMVFTGGMSWVSPKEREVHIKGLVDEHFFQTPRMAWSVSSQLYSETKKPVFFRDGYTPYINASNQYADYAGHIKKPVGEFRVGKAVRDDLDKWHSDHWRMYASITAPKETKLHFEIYGWGGQADRKIGNPCSPNSVYSNRFNMNISGHEVSPTKMAQFYGRSHVLLHYYPFVESFGFATLQAMLARCVPIGAAEGGFLDLIRHGGTGFLASCPDEAAYYTSKLAFEDATWWKMSEAAAKWVIDEGPGNPDKCWPWWEELLKSREISF